VSSHRAVLENAKRLVSDAQHLFDVGRLRSSIALVILAAEEIGKIGILGLNDEERTASEKETGQTFERQLSNHWAKLSAFFSFCQIHMMRRVEQAALKAKNLPDTKEGRAALRKLTAQAIDQSPEFKVWLEQLYNEGYGPEFACNFTNAYLFIFGDSDGFGDVSGQIGTGVANRLTKFGFYVDMNGSDSPSGEDEREDARRWISAVTQLLESDIIKAVVAGIEREEQNKLLTATGR
jgi:AbiV family abortive infection protein